MRYLIPCRKFVPVFLTVLFFVFLTASRTQDTTPRPVMDQEFYFARLEYTGKNTDPSALKNWWTDYSAMETNLVSILNRITRVRSGAALVKPSSPEIYGYPLIYTVEPTQITVTQEEVAYLREYLQRGGFWFADDFHGDDELAAFRATLQQVIPEFMPSTGTQFDELTPTHEIGHTFFDINTWENVVNDGLASCREAGCDQFENGPSGKIPHIYVVRDGDGTIVVLMAHNTDLGDGLEWADTASYPRQLSSYSAKFVVNLIIYALSH